MHLHLPGGGEERPWILRIHRQAGAPGVLVDEQHAVPMRAAVGGPVDAALLLLAGDAAERAREHDIRVRGMHEDSADAAGLVEAAVRPRPAGVERPVNAVADDVA